MKTEHAALAYTAHGWPIFPLKPKAKEPLTPHGYKDAGIDGHQIENWLKRWPNANVGPPTGRKSGIIVLDVDPRNGGDESLAALEAQHGPLPRTVEARTGSGGRHILFRHPGGEVRCSAGQLGPGLDIKGDGGYVVISPSVHPNDNRYEWIHPPFNSMPLADPPAWLLAKPTDDQRRAEPVDDVIPYGQQHYKLVSLAGSMRKRGLGVDEIEAALQIVNARRCERPGPAENIRQIAESVCTLYPPGDKKELLSAGYKKDVLAERVLTFRSAREIALQTPAETTWLAAPYVAEGSITEVDGPIKSAGKTTWVMSLVRSALDGLPFMGQPTTKTPVVYLTEQTGPSLTQALARANLLDRDDLAILRWHDTFGVEWADVVRAAVVEAKKIGAKLLVVDTLGQFAGLKGDAENDAGKALEAIAPLQMAAGTGLAVIIVRHERKGGGEVGEAARGSSAFGGAVDIILSLRRAQGEGRPTIRTLQALSRFDETPASVVIELTPRGYVLLGDESQYAVEEARAAILDVAPTTEENAIRLDDLIAKANVKRSTAQAVITGLMEDGRLIRVGAGKRNDPYKFYIGENSFCQNPYSISGRKKTNQSERCAFVGCDAEVWRFTPGGVGLCEQHYVECDEQAGGSQ